eukprot:TRINITY_DN813_c0_g1_i2.p1 TRINITY_DN813_c0_g1~~TRINITY_DN813_c0_g1_i2.p1  ORF type:complete len:256 (-),score=55.01 TRINITY_DN813_c0_g1_i2:297-950(-)
MKSDDTLLGASEKYDCATPNPLFMKHTEKTPALEEDRDREERCIEREREEEEEYDNGEFPPIINYGEIDAFGRPIHHPAVTMINDVVIGVKRITREITESIKSLIDLCEGRLQDLLHGRSIFPLPWFGDPSFLDEILPLGVYLGLVLLLDTKRRPASVRHEGRTLMYTFRGDTDKERSIRICISDRHRTDEPVPIPCVCILSMKNSQNRAAGFWRQK